MADLASLADVTFLDSDAAAVEERLVADYETVSGRTVAAGDPARLFLEGVTLEIALLRQEADTAAKQNLLADASGDYLDQLGALLDVSRLAASAAMVTLRFALTEALDFAVTVPAGTRATPDGTLMFATDAAAVIPAGSLYVDAAATCSTVGADGNGFAAGEIARLVDVVPWIASVASTTASEGGADQESDDHLRDRIAIRPESFSVAGPDGAYIYWAKTASSLIADVGVLSPAPVQVSVYPLLEDGQIPGQEILDSVAAAVATDRKVRPLTDQVSVLAPEAVEYDITVTWWLGSSDQTNADAITAAVAAAVDDYRAWQRARLGRDINPTELVYRMRAAGAKRVQVDSPAHLALSGSQVAAAGTVTVTYGGIEED